MVKIDNLGGILHSGTTFEAREIFEGEQDRL
jgi:hypothetical protein